MHHLLLNCWMQQLQTVVKVKGKKMGMCGMGPSTARQFITVLLVFLFCFAFLKIIFYMF